MPEKITRREFLRIMGAAAVGLALVGIGRSALIGGSDKAGMVKQASAQQYGSWQLGGTTHATPIHAAMLHNGKVLYAAGSGFYAENELGPFQQGVYDPATDTDSPLPTIDEDMFCVGHNQLPDGNILFTGGTLTYNSRSPNGKWLGLNAAWVFDVASNNLRRIESIKHGRWYPTHVTLADGKVLVVGGWDEYGVQNRLAELFDPSTEKFSIWYDPQSTESWCAGQGQDPAIMPGAGETCYGPGVAPNVLLYPRMHLMPEGLVAVCGQSKTMRTFNPATGVWKFAGNMLFGSARGYGSSVLLPLQNTTQEKGSILIFGGTATADDYATTSAEILTPSGTSLSSRWTTASNFGRKHPIPVIMPDGKILVIGGTAFQNLSSTKIMEAELFDPVTETWETLPAMTVPRQYHSSAILLPDGRVWTGGTTYSLTSRELRVEYFVPHYYNSSSRPTISGDPLVGNYGQTITIPTPDAPDIDAASLVMLSTETHAGNMDQRLVWLQIQNKSATEVVVSAPINGNIAPPCYYFLHVLKAGIPSVGAIVKIPGDYSPPADTTLPAVAIVSPAADEVLTGPAPGFAVEVTGTASDPESGLQVVEVSVDGEEFAPATGTDTWSFTTETLTGGAHTITARARDHAGNTQETTINFTVEVTLGGTFVNIYSVPGTNSYGNIMTGGPVGIGETLTSASSLIDSAIKRMAVILKKSGSPTGSIYFRIRNSSGTIVKELGTIDASTLTSADQRFEVTASSAYILKANDKVLVEWDGTGSNSDVVHVKRHGTDAFDGTNTYFVARNSSGTYSSSSGRDLAGDWYYESSEPADTTLPSVDIVSPTEGQTLTGTSPGIAVGVTGTASDSESGLQVVEVSVDSGPFSPATGTDSWSFTTETLTGGAHTITARAKDNAGNIQEAMINITIELEGTGQFISIYSVTGDNSYGSMSSTGSSSDVTGIGETLTSSSSLIGSYIKRIAAVLKKAGSPTGTVYFRIRNSSGTIVKELGTVDASSLTPSDQVFEVTASSAHTLQANDKVLIEWDGTGSSADVVHVKRKGSDAFDGTNTYFVARKAGGTYSGSSTRDLAGDWYYEG